MLHCLQSVSRRLSMNDSRLIDRRGISQCNAHKKSIELIFWQQICSFKLIWILSRNDHKWIRQWMHFSFRSNSAFSHRFEQCRLRARRCSIDFVSEHDVGENWSLPKCHLSRFAVIHPDARNVRRQKIWRALNATKRAVHAASE